MTNEEAIKELKEVLKEDRETYQDFFINQGYAYDGEIKRGLLALDKVIEALEKQIPKKPERDEEYPLGRVCPKCCAYLGNVQFISSNHDYCERCGQALDWSGEE